VLVVVGTVVKYAATQAPFPSDVVECARMHTEDGLSDAGVAVRAS
jgi:hypothetical protein